MLDINIQNKTKNNQQTKRKTKNRFAIEKYLLHWQTIAIYIRSEFAGNISENYSLGIKED